MMTDTNSPKFVSGVGLRHRFKKTADLFTNLSFELRPGGIVGICGPSGSGKSTLLGIIAGWIIPEEGEVQMGGIARVGWVFQNPFGVPGRTALDHVCLPLLARGQTRQDAERRALEVMAHFNLANVAGQPFRELSGGEAQRLCSPDQFVRLQTCCWSTSPRPSSTGAWPQP